MNAPKASDETHRDARRHVRAIAMVVASAVIASLGGLFIRHIESANDWQVITWRSAALVVGMVVIVIATNPGSAIGEFRRIGRIGVVGGFLFGGTLVGYVLAISNTTIANAVFTMSATPFFTAVLAWAVLGERVRRWTAVAIAVAIGGIGLMVSDGLATGSVFGNAMAIMAAIGFAGFVVILRKARATNQLPATVIAALFATVVGAFMAGGDIAVSWHDLALCLVWGAGASSVALLLVILASRHLAGAELSLIILLEFILAPTWVWLAVDEVPSEITLIGGAIVLTAVGGHTLLSMRKPPAPEPEKP